MYEYPFGAGQQLNLNWIISEIISIHKSLDPDYVAPVFDNTFPFTNLNVLNLDWILKELKEIKELAPSEDATILKMVANALIAATYDPDENYSVNDIVYRDSENRIFVCINDTSGDWNADDWFEINVGTALTVLLDTVFNPIWASGVQNDSNVTGVTVEDALNTLQDAVNYRVKIVADTTLTTTLDNIVNYALSQISAGNAEYGKTFSFRVSHASGSDPNEYFGNSKVICICNFQQAEYGCGILFSDSTKNIATFYRRTNVNTLYPIGDFQGAFNNQYVAETNVDLSGAIADSAINSTTGYISTPSTSWEIVRGISIQKGQTIKIVSPQWHTVAVIARDNGTSQFTPLVIGADSNDPVTVYYTATEDCTIAISLKTTSTYYAIIGGAIPILENEVDDLKDAINHGIFAVAGTLKSNISSSGNIFTQTATDSRITSSTNIANVIFDDPSLVTSTSFTVTPGTGTITITGTTASFSGTKNVTVECYN